MKKFIILLSTVMLLAVSAGSSQAMIRKDREYITAKVESVNPKTKEMTVVDYDTGAKRTFIVQKGWENAIPNRSVVINAIKGTNIAKAVTQVKQK